MTSQNMTSQGMTSQGMTSTGLFPNVNDTPRTPSLFVANKIQRGITARGKGNGNGMAGSSANGYGTGSSAGNGYGTTMTATNILNTWNPPSNYGSYGNVPNHGPNNSLASLRSVIQSQEAPINSDILSETKTNLINAAKTNLFIYETLSRRSPSRMPNSTPGTVPESTPDLRGGVSEQTLATIPRSQQPVSLNLNSKSRSDSISSDYLTDGNLLGSDGAESTQDFSQNNYPDGPERVDIDWLTDLLSDKETKDVDTEKETNTADSGTEDKSTDSVVEDTRESTTSNWWGDTVSTNAQSSQGAASEGASSGSSNIEEKASDFSDTSSGKMSEPGSASSEKPSDQTIVNGQRLPAFEESLSHPSTNDDSNTPRTNMTMQNDSSNSSHSDNHSDIIQFPKFQLGVVLPSMPEDFNPNNPKSAFENVNLDEDTFTSSDGDSIHTLSPSLFPTHQNLKTVSPVSSLSPIPVSSLSPIPPVLGSSSSFSPVPDINEASSGTLGNDQFRSDRDVNDWVTSESTDSPGGHLFRPIQE